MKVIKSYMGISLLAVLLLFSGCGKEMEDMTIPETGSGVESPDGSDQAEGEILRLQVSDAGFSDANTGSRAIDEGLTTTFEDGDQIGLFVVNSQNKILYANVPYIKDGDAWSAKENIRTKGYPVRVFAYYPYVPDDEIIEKVDSTADNYSAFFKQYIDELDISNQSSLVGYRKADVMACMVEVGDKETARQPLRLAMNHVMGLVIVNLPKTVTLTSVEYYLKGDESYSWTAKNVTLPANLSDELFEVMGDIRPLKEETGYRYLCKCGEDNISFSGGFTTYGTKKDYMVSSTTVLAGSSKTYNVSVNPFDALGKVEYILQPGDFYMKDGSILSGSSDPIIGSCIGIVFWSGNPTNTDRVLAKDHSSCTHGLVVSLRETDRAQWQGAFENNSIQSWAAKQEFYISGEYKSLNNNVSGGYNNSGEIQGYNNTEILKKYDSSHPKYPVELLSYLTGVSLPEGKTSGWYLPSPRELVELSKVKTQVNNSLRILGMTQFSSSHYWSSGEHSFRNAWSVNSSGLTSYENKGYYVDWTVRLVFAF